MTGRIKDPAQKVECNSCIWEGYEIELKEETENNMTFDVCPACDDPSISYIGYA